MKSDEATPAKGAPRSAAQRVMVHGVLVAASGIGVLITGDSGVGKTACGLEVVARGGFWIADDAVVLEERGGLLYGRGHERTRDMIAVRGRGILDARSLLGASALCGETQVHAVMQFVRHAGRPGTEPGGEGGSTTVIEGVPLICRRAAAGASPREMADDLLRLVGECLLRKEPECRAG